MRAILVSVDYSDFLALTLPYNRHHFDEVLVVTTHSDIDTARVATECNADVFMTEAFYDGEAVFNKWKALEQGLDEFGRHGLICIMDADVMWPKQLPEMTFECGKLYTPRRRMYRDVRLPIPDESEWHHIELAHQERDWSGYSQIFHAEDPHLGPAPWHEINWKHAGGADTFFQRKWSKDCKIRPPFEVLHLGQEHKNWCGRTTEYVGGGQPAESRSRRVMLHEFLQGRQGKRNKPDEFDHERF